MLLLEKKTPKRENTAYSDTKVSPQKYFRAIEQKWNKQFLIWFSPFQISITLYVLIYLGNENVVNAWEHVENENDRDNFLK